MVEMAGELLRYLWVDPGTRQAGHKLPAERVEVEVPALFVPVGQSGPLAIGPRSSGLAFSIHALRAAL